MMAGATEEEARARRCDLFRTAVRSGTIAAIAMIPVGLAFYLAGLRVNEYGPRIVQILFGGLPPGGRFAAFAALHFLISWTASVPLLLILATPHRRVPALLLGAIYGLAFYVAVNSFALPWIFGDSTPWQLGLAVVAPSLIVHLEYGAIIAITADGSPRGRTALRSPAERTSSRGRINPGG